LIPAKRKAEDSDENKENVPSSTITTIQTNLAPQNRRQIVLVYLKDEEKLLNVTSIKRAGGTHYTIII
jgi:hypothetical protein